MYVTSRDVRSGKGCGHDDHGTAGRCRCADLRLDALVGPLDPAVRDALLEALDDEHRSIAFCAAVLDRFPAAMPFAHMVGAETRHAAKIAAVLRACGVAVPENRHLGSAAIARLVPASVACACDIAVKAELDNVVLYEDRLLPAVADQPVVTELFTWLMIASRDRHLPAYRRWTAGQRFGGIAP